MDDKQLHNLKNMKAPTPSEGAQKEAMQAAMQAFEATKAGVENKKEKNFQGISGVLRLIHSINQELWSFIMKKQLIVGTALTSVLAVTIAVSMYQTNPNVIPMPEPMVAIQPLAVVKEPGKSQERTSQEPVYIVPTTREKMVTPQTGQAEIIAMPPKASVSKNIAAPGIAADSSQGVALLRAMPEMSYHSKPIIAGDYIRPQVEYQGRDQFEKKASNPVKRVSEEPVSTFSIDVDTASYAFVRKQLNRGVMPAKDAVRVEELINYFDYDYPLPEKVEQPFKSTVAIYPTPWSQDTKLLHIGIKGHDMIPAETPRSNLVFLLDVSGSMNHKDKLPLLKNAFRLLVDNMHPEDTVSIVTYAGQAGTVLEPTKVAEKEKILGALRNLRSCGATAGAQGIRQAYALAESSFKKDGVNRVILATDGDFNVGIRNRDELKDYIAKKRKSGVFLSVLGFGQGNYNDALMQALAQNGNGNAAYIDTLNEARKVLVEEASSTLYPIAKDVKIQIEFNPKAITEYRLIGYETRILNREDFNNDKVDAGDIGSGHTVTAIYEITPVGSKAQAIDDLRYQPKEKVATKEPEEFNEYAFLKLRYKLPNEDVSTKIEYPITKEMEYQNIARTSEDIRFAASVAAFGQKLRSDSSTEGYAYDDIIALAKDARGDDPFGYRNEFLSLVRLAKSVEGIEE